MIKQLLPTSWEPYLAPQFQMPYFAKLESLVSDAYMGSVVYPSQENLFRALRFVAPSDVKVVILGQDPYHEPNQAHGLAFSVPDDCKTPGSLNHIFQEIVMETSVEPLHSNSLVRWAEQGVLLLNTTLTVEQGKAASHRNFGWSQFTDAIISVVSQQSPHVAFMLWGSDAASKAQIIDQQKHLILTSTHPSGLSWGKTSKPNSMRGMRLTVEPNGVINRSDEYFIYDGFGRSKNNSFWGSMHFVAANNFLISHNLKPIVW